MVIRDQKTPTQTNITLLKCSPEFAIEKRFSCVKIAHTHTLSAFCQHEIIKVWIKRPADNVPIIIQQMKMSRIGKWMG